MIEISERDKAKVLDGFPSANHVLNFAGLQGHGATLIDRSQYANNISSITPTWKRLPSGLKYLNFNGTSDSLIPGTNGNDTEFDITTAISCGAWVYITSLATHNAVISRDDTTNRNYLLWVASNGSVQFYIWSSNAAKYGAAATAGVVINKWYLVGGSYDKVTVRAYVNGVKGTLAEDASTGNIDNDNVPLYIGRRSGATPNWFVGGMALPFLSNANMTDAQWLQKFNHERRFFGV